MDTEDLLEEAYWRFDGKRSGYGDYKLNPQSERNAFKSEFRHVLHKCISKTILEKIDYELNVIRSGNKKPTLIVMSDKFYRTFMQEINRLFSHGTIIGDWNRYKGIRVLVDKCMDRDFEIE